MVIELKKYLSSMNITKNNEDLFTRFVGKKLLDKVLKKLKNIMENEVCIVDFNGIKSVDASFVDEFIVNLLNMSINNEKNFYIKIVNINDNIEYNIERVLELHVNEKKYAIMTDRLCSNNCHALGELNDIQKDIIEFIIINNGVTKDDIITSLQIDNDVVENNLNDLINNKLIIYDNIQSKYHTV